jgi:hypothetical protein
MSRTEHIRILVVALVGLVGVSTVEAFTLLGIQEWIKFALAVVTFFVILLGSYWFVLAQSDRRSGQGR